MAPRFASSRRQHGVSLFITLVVLVVMSLVGIALMRSVSGGLLVSGNLGFKRAATNAADLGIDAAVRAIANTSFDTTTRVGAPAWFYPDMRLDPLTQIDWGSNAARSPEIDGPLGNTVAYIVQRMCERDGPVVADTCVTMPSATDNAGKRSPHYNERPITGGTGVYLRVTVRVTGPKGTTSFVQVALGG